MSLDDEILKAKREFEANYKSFLENKLLLETLTEITQPQASHGLNNNLAKKIDEHFLRSFLNVGNQLSTEQKLLISETKLDSEAKTYLVKKIEQNLQLRLDEINENFKYVNSDADWLLGDRSASLDISGSVEPHQVLLNVNNLLECIDKSRLDTSKAISENALKQESLFMQSIETLGLLYKILKEFKLEFYSMKNQVECENEIVECDMLIGKIQTITDGLKLDLYSGDNLKALEKIHNSIATELASARDEHSQVMQVLDAYESLGDSFKSLLRDYFELNEKLEGKKWQLSQLEATYNF